MRSAIKKRRSFRPSWRGNTFGPYRISTIISLSGALPLSSFLKARPYLAHQPLAPIAAANCSSQSDKPLPTLCFPARCVFVRAERQGKLLTSARCRRSYLSRAVGIQRRYRRNQKSEIAWRCGGKVHSLRRPTIARIKPAYTLKKVTPEHCCGRWVDAIIEQKLPISILFDSDERACRECRAVGGNLSTTTNTNAHSG